MKIMIVPKDRFLSYKAQYSMFILTKLKIVVFYRRIIAKFK